ncbi:hypothetical protein D3C81_1565730 [compost metagenome]
MKTNNAIRAKELGITTQVLPLHAKNFQATYYQVEVGNYGVTVPQGFNVDNPEELRLTAGKATRIDLEATARDIARLTKGNAIKVTEKFERTLEQI